MQFNWILKLIIILEYLQNIIINYNNYYNMPKNIFIQDINHFELLEKNINLIPDWIFDYYFIFNNSGTQIPFNTKHFKVIDRFGILSFKQIQNAMREYAILYNFDYYCLMHDGK